MTLRWLNAILSNNPFWSKADVYFYSTVLALFLFALYLNRDKIWKRFKESERLTLGLLGSITGVAALIRFLNINTSFHIADSAWEYLLGARYFVFKGFIYKCYSPSFLDCSFPTPISHPAMYSLVNGMVYKITGFNPEVTVYFAFLISVATIPIAFLALYNYLEDKTAAVVGAGILAVIPLHVIYSGLLDGTLGVFSALSAFFVLLAVGFVLKNDDFKSWIFLFSTLLFAIGFRWENPLLLFVALFIILAERRKPLDYLKEKLLDKKTLIPFIIFLFLLIPLLKGAYNVWILQESVGSSFTLGYFMRSLQNFGHIFSQLYWLPALFVVCLLPFALLSDVKKSLIGIFWLLSFSLLYASFQNGLTPRYLMNTLPPLTFLGALGYSGLSKTLSNLTKRKSLLNKTLSISMVIFLLSTVFFISYESGNRKGNVDKLIELANYSKGKAVVFPDINTLLTFFCYTEKKPAVAFLGLPKLYRKYGRSDFYFMRTHRCRIENFREICNYLSSIGELRKSEDGWKLYYISLNKKQKSKIEELVKSHNL